MEKQILKRILQLKQEQHLSDIDFAGKAKTSVGTLNRIVRAADKDDLDSKIKPQTIKDIARNLGASLEWVMTGRGEKMAIADQNEQTWKDEAYATLMATNNFLQRKIDELMQMQSQAHNTIAALANSLPGKNKAFIIPGFKKQVEVRPN